MTWFGEKEKTNCGLIHGLLLKRGQPQKTYQGNQHLGQRFKLHSSHKQIRCVTADSLFYTPAVC